MVDYFCKKMYDINLGESIMKIVNRTDFISMLSENLPVLCFFHEKEENNQIKEIKDAILKIEKDLPRLKTFEFIRNATEADEQLCDIMEIATYPILVVYKGGNFSRYKAKEFSEKEILKFLGNTKIYESQKSKSEIEVEVI
jgi:hypothetical protein